MCANSAICVVCGQVEGDHAADGSCYTKGPERFAPMSPRTSELVAELAKATEEGRIVWEVDGEQAYETTLRRSTLRMDDTCLWVTRPSPMRLLTKDIAPIQRAREAVVVKLIDALIEELHLVR